MTDQLRIKLDEHVWTGSVSVENFLTCLPVVFRTFQEFMRMFDLSGDNQVTLQEYITALGLDPPPPAE